MDLREQSVHRLVSLTDYARQFGPWCRKAGLQWTYFPIDDFSVPEETGRFGQLMEELLADITAGRAVCVHCFAGIGRTGLVLACLVGRYFDIGGEEAIRRTRAVRPALETRDQELFVRRFLNKTR
jgi:protein-tyrosine phosphatase